MKIRKKLKYDFIIYTCLILALILIGVESYPYLHNTSYSFKDLFTQKKELEVKEPVSLESVDKKILIINYINDLLDQISTDEILTYEMLRSWNNYEIINIDYDKEILKDYHSYLVDIEIENRNAILPTKKNKEKSTNGKLVITLKMNILKSKTTNEFIVKSIDVPKNN